MPELLIIADDFTGALDTGVQLAAAGAETRVVTDRAFDFSELDPAVSVLVMDSETRHMSAEDAYLAISEITERAFTAGIRYIYKKTDSALRGNIGAELSAVLDTSKESKLSFIPAFPQMKRVTRGGIHYVDGLPVQESVFGRDPFDPVRSSDVSELIHFQRATAVKSVSLSDGRGILKEGTERAEILVWDAEREEELREIGRLLKEEGALRVLAGCAGFAAVLPELLSLGGKRRRAGSFTKGFLVICGSVNPITVAQLDYAEEKGFHRIRLSPEEKFLEGYWDTEEGEKRFSVLCEEIRRYPCVILDSNDAPGTALTQRYAELHGLGLEEVRTRIAQSFGKILKRLRKTESAFTVMITGGDTLMGCMNAMRIHELIPVCELEPGTVLSVFLLNGQEQTVISKSGGFGSRRLLCNLADRIFEEKQERAQNEGGASERSGL